MLCNIAVGDDSSDATHISEVSFTLDTQQHRWEDKYNQTAAQKTLENIITQHLVSITK